MRAARGQDLIAHQHSEIFMHGIVAMLYVSAAEFAELHLELHASRLTQAPHVFSRKPFGRRHRRATPVHRHTLFEVQMNGMVPASTTVHKCPVLDLAGPGDEQRYPVGIKRVSVLSVHLDGPRECRELWTIRRALAGSEVP